jgi:hypothetical protein
LVLKGLIFVVEFFSTAEWLRRLAVNTFAKGLCQAGKRLEAGGEQLLIYVFCSQPLKKLSLQWFFKNRHSAAGLTIHDAFCNRAK